MRYSGGHPAIASTTTLLLLHGYTGHSRYWDAFAQDLTDRYRVLVLDQRGHGESGWSPNAAYGTDEMMLDLRHRTDHALMLTEQGAGPGGMTARCVTHPRHVVE